MRWLMKQKSIGQVQPRGKMSLTKSDFYRVREVACVILGTDEIILLKIEQEYLIVQAKMWFVGSCMQDKIQADMGESKHRPTVFSI